jgi:rhamnose utilization protein RhaD (predicted bifunctional aldolase and dehydrogenase)
MIDNIIELSHAYGGTFYVRGGGGNTSCKDATSLWIKPSGTTLATLTRETLVRMDRAKMAELYDYVPSPDATQREADVKDLMAASVFPDSSGRPSVEAPLHDSFPYIYVVHTHPARVNGLTCGTQGPAECERLFPDALWVPYVDPGYTLCMVVREAMMKYTERTGACPKLVVLENHGIFVAADSVREIHDLYAHVMDTLGAEYSAANTSESLTLAGDSPDAETISATTAAIQSALGPKQAAYVAAHAPFHVPQGPLTPDHIVYSKSYALECDTVDATAIEAFIAANGYPPSVVRTAAGVFGVGSTEKDAALAVEFAEDGSIVEQLTAKYGGMRYLTDASREFIENWEVESYRKQISTE